MPLDDTTDDSAPRLYQMLPPVAADLYAFVMREHDDRRGQLGAAWWAIARDAYQGTGGFMRSVDAVASFAGGSGNVEQSGTRNRSSYLTPFRRESADAFTARANRSAYQNHVAPVIDVYHGHLVRRRPERASSVEAITSWWSNVAGHGHDIGEWIAGVALRAQLYGWCAVLVDRPDTSDLAEARRTTATALDPGELRDWQIGHDGRLDWARIVSEWTERDPATGAAVRIVEASLWTRQEWARVRLESRDREAWVELARTGGRHDLGRVPLAVLRWQEQIDARALYGLSQVQGVVPLVLGLFSNDSELTDHLANANFALLAVNGEPDALSNLKIGTNNGITYPPGTTAPSFISPGADVAMQYALRGEQLLAAIYTAAKMEKPGASPTGGDPASGIAKAYDFSQTDAGLQTFARQLTRFEFELTALVAGWASLGDAAKVDAAVAATTITYPMRFDAAGIQSDLGAQFAVLDDKVRAQFPPEVIRQARLALSRGLYPEASPEIEAAIVEEITAMYERERAVVAAAPVDDAIAALPAADAADPLNTAIP